MSMRISDLILRVVLKKSLQSHKWLFRRDKGAVRASRVSKVIKVLTVIKKKTQASQFNRK